MKRLAIILVIVILAPSILIGLLVKGCDPTDVTLSPEYKFQSFAGTMWKTKVKMAVAQRKNYRGHGRLVLLTPEFFDATHPEYQVPYPEHKVVIFLPVGSRLRIERLMQDNGSWGGREVFVSLPDQAIPSDENGNLIMLPHFFLAPNRHLRTGESEEWDVDPELLEKAR
jgi:hypothetical protein